MPPWLCRLFPRLCAAVTPAPAPAPATPVAAADIAAQVNAARAMSGLGPLGHDPLLDRSAAEEVADCIAHNALGHYDFPGRIASAHPNTAGGENISLGYATAAAIVAGWMSDPGHRANVLGRWTIVGCASGVGRDGQLYACADFDRE